MNESDWEQESYRWQRFDQEISHQTNNAVYELIVQNLAEPARLKPNFPALMAGVSNLFQDKSDIEAAVKITAALGAWPERWGYGVAWEKQVRIALASTKDHPQHPQSAILKATLAELLYDSSQLSEALTFALEAIQQARSVRDAEALSLGLKTQIAVRWAQAENIAIQEEIGNFQSELVQWGMPESQIRRFSVCLKIMQVLILRSSGQSDLARKTVLQLIDEIQHIEQVDVHYIADCYQVSGVMEWANGNITAAQKGFEKAGDLYSRAGASTMLAYIHANIALALLSQGRLIEGNEYSLRSFELNAKIHNTIRHVNAYGLLGLSYYLARRFKIAADIFNRQIKLAEKTGNSRSYHLAIDNTLSLKVMQGKYQQAIPGLLKSLEHYKAIGAKERQLGTEIDLLLCYKGQKDLTQAEFFANSIENLLNNGGLERNTPVALRAIALCRPSDKAEALLQTAHNLAMQGGYLMEQAACLLLLSALTPSQEDRQLLWRKADRLCQTCGASAWLKGRSPDNPPFLPFVV